MSKIDSQSFVAGVHNQPTDPVISLSYSSHFALFLYWSVCFPLPNTCTSLFVLFAKYLESKILSRVSRKLQLASRWCNIVLKKVTLHLSLSIGFNIENNMLVRSTSSLEVKAHHLTFSKGLMLRKSWG